MMIFAAIVKNEPRLYDDFFIESGGRGIMAAKPRARDWHREVKGLLKAELKRRDLTYADLAGKLAAIGIKDNARNIANKISRGTFTAAFFVQCLEAVGCKTLHLNANENHNDATA